jgi:hypothetical protein
MSQHEESDVRIVHHEVRTLKAAITEQSDKIGRLADAISEQTLHSVRELESIKSRMATLEERQINQSTRLTTVEVVAHANASYIAQDKPIKDIFMNVFKALTVAVALGILTMAYKAT